MALPKRLLSSRSSAFANQVSKLLGNPGLTLDGVGSGPLAICARIIATP
jgi:hypothetical protein